jgi:hypothetical protein
LCCISIQVQSALQQQTPLLRVLRLLRHQFPLSLCKINILLRFIADIGG